MEQSQITCASAADLANALIARHGWQIVTAQQLLDGAAHGQPTTSQFFHTYVLMLHATCSGREGLERQERGYTELYGYLQRRALRRYPDVAADAAQRAIEAVFRNFANCRVPGAFLAFAAQQLLNAARIERRLSAPADRPLDEVETELAVADDDPYASAEASETGRRFFACAERFVRQHPRAKLQLAALWLKHIEQLDDSTIADRMRRSVSSVQTLRSRAAARLRSDPEWRALAADLGYV